MYIYIYNTYIFLKHYLVEMIQFDKYLPSGLKPPTIYWCIYIYIHMMLLVPKSFRLHEFLVENL